MLELISTIWDSELHIAGLRLLNNLPLPDFAHPQLRRVMPALMEILQADYILAQVAEYQSPGPALLTSPGTAPRGRSRDLCLPCSGPPVFSFFTLSFIQVQAAQLLSNLAQKNDLLYDILNCQVRKELKDGLMDVNSDIVKGRNVDSSDRLSPHRIILFLFLPLH